MRAKNAVIATGICVMVATLLVAAFVPTLWLAIFDAVIVIILLATTCVNLEEKQQHA